MKFLFGEPTFVTSDNFDVRNYKIEDETEDFLLNKNRAMHKFLEEKGVKHVYWEDPGIRDMNFWGK